MKTTLRISDENISIKLQVEQKVYDKFVEQQTQGMKVEQQLALINKIGKEV